MDNIVAYIADRLLTKIKEDDFFKHKVENGEFLFDPDFLEAYVNEKIAEIVTDPIFEICISELQIHINDNIPSELAEKFKQNLIEEQEDEPDEDFED